jgi:hypothetical protein
VSEAALSIFAYLSAPLSCAPDRDRNNQSSQTQRSNLHRFDGKSGSRFLTVASCDGVTLADPARYPRPTNGIWLAMTVMNSTLASSGRLAM